MPPTRGISCLSLVLYGIRIGSEGLTLFLVTPGHLGVVLILSVITLEKSPQFIKDDHLLMPCLLNLNF